MICIGWTVSILYLTTTERKLAGWDVLLDVSLLSLMIVFPVCFFVLNYRLRIEWGSERLVSYYNVWKSSSILFKDLKKVQTGSHSGHSFLKLVDSSGRTCEFDLRIENRELWGPDIAYAAHKNNIKLSKRVTQILGSSKIDFTTYVPSFERDWAVSEAGAKVRASGGMPKKANIRVGWNSQDKSKLRGQLLALLVALIVLIIVAPPATGAIAGILGVRLFSLEQWVWVRKDKVHVKLAGAFSFNAYERKGITAVDLKVLEDEAYIEASTKAGFTMVLATGLSKPEAIEELEYALYELNEALVG